MSLNGMDSCFAGFFPFHEFNGLQKQCYSAAYQSNRNLIISAPTSSGKTVIFELATLRNIKDNPGTLAVYLGPTKALCSERYRDWAPRFRSIGAVCLEVTGDAPLDLRQIIKANLLVTTPEKLDSLTRSFMSQLKKPLRLLMVDELHIIGEDRGAALEALVTRWKTVNPDLRIVCASATLSNIDQLARWLKDTQGPAITKVFRQRESQLTVRVQGFLKEGSPFHFESSLTRHAKGIVAEQDPKTNILIVCSLFLISVVL